MEFISYEIFQIASSGFDLILTSWLEVPLEAPLLEAPLLVAPLLV